MKKNLSKAEVYISDKPILVGKTTEVSDTNVDQSEERKRITITEPIDRIEQLEIMRSNTENILLCYYKMRHPNKQKFIAVYERNLQRINEELQRLQMSVPELKE